MERGPHIPIEEISPDSDIAFALKGVGEEVKAECFAFEVKLRQLLAFVEQNGENGSKWLAIKRQELRQNFRAKNIIANDYRLYTLFIGDSLYPHFFRPITAATIDHNGEIAGFLDDCLAKMRDGTWEKEMQEATKPEPPYKPNLEWELVSASKGVRKAAFDFFNRCQELNRLVKDAQWYGEIWFIRKRDEIGRYLKEKNVAVENIPFYHIFVGSSLDPSFYKNVTVTLLDSRKRVSRFVDDCLAKMTDGSWMQEAESWVNQESRQMTEAFAKKYNELYELFAKVKSSEMLERQVDKYYTMHQEFKRSFTEKHSLHTRRSYELPAFLKLISSHPIKQMVQSNYDHYHFKDPSELDIDGEVMEFVEKCIEEFKK